MLKLEILSLLCYGWKYPQEKALSLRIEKEWENQTVIERNWNFHNVEFLFAVIEILISRRRLNDLYITIKDLTSSLKFERR